MSKKRLKEQIYLIVVLAVALLLLTALASLSAQGFKHLIKPQMHLRAAQEAWQDGEMLRAASQLVMAVETSLEGQFRWLIARHIYLNLTGFWQRNGRLDNALTSCAQGARILGGFDDEGSYSYICSEIHIEAILRNSGQFLGLDPTPPGSSEPKIDDDHSNH
jgi:hypothetical protein